jgi:hypothetical protein
MPEVWQETELELNKSLITMTRGKEFPSAGIRKARSRNGKHTSYFQTGCNLQLTQATASCKRRNKGNHPLIGNHMVTDIDGVLDS